MQDAGRAVTVAPRGQPYGVLGEAEPVADRAEVHRHPLPRRRRRADALVCGRVEGGPDAARGRDGGARRGGAPGVVRGPRPDAARRSDHRPCPRCH